MAVVDEEESSDDSDEWGMAELVIPPPTYVRATKDDYEPDNNDEADKDNEDYWKIEPRKEEPTKNRAGVTTVKTSANIPPPVEEEAMIIVDMTQVDPTIHSKFDKNSVNSFSCFIFSFICLWSFKE